MDSLSDMESGSWVATAGTVLLTLVLAYFGYQLLFQTQPFIPLDYVNFVTHETGGVLFLWCNQFYFMLGQNVYQNLVPLAFLFYFLRRKELIAGGFSAFWLGDSILQTGNYMKDAQSMLLPITTIWSGGGNDHDWNYMFSQSGLLPYSQAIGVFFWLIGAVLVVGSVGYLCYLSIKRIYPNFTFTANT